MSNIKEQIRSRSGIKEMHDYPTYRDPYNAPIEKAQKKVPEMKSVEVEQKILNSFNMFYKDIVRCKEDIDSLPDKSKKVLQKKMTTRLQVAYKIIKYLFEKDKTKEVDDDVKTVMIKIPSSTLGM